VAAALSSLFRALSLGLQSSLSMGSGRIAEVWVVGGLIGDQGLVSGRWKHYPGFARASGALLINAR
jgi:hypothetical protein